MTRVAITAVACRSTEKRTRITGSCRGTSQGVPGGRMAQIRGYGGADCASLAEGARPQQRLLQNAPVACDTEMLVEMFRGAISCW